MINDICRVLDFPTEAVSYLSECEKKLLSDPRWSNECAVAMADFLRDGAGEYKNILAVVSERTGISRYTIDMLFALSEAEALHQRYREQGISDSIYYDTLSDMRCKLIECRKLYGVWGTFVLSWYRGFFRMTRFALGRLQYERIAFPLDGYGNILKRGDAVYSCHIPSSGPLCEEAVMDSLRRAYRFYKDELCDGILPVFCSSWMMYPENERLFPKGSNLYKFYRLFTPLESVDKPENPDFWRIFYMPYSEKALPIAPEDTELQRNIKRHLLHGGSMGSTRAILLFDGERVL